jgi:hypothetical protein
MRRRTEFAAIVLVLSVATLAMVAQSYQTAMEGGTATVSIKEVNRGQSFPHVESQNSSGGSGSAELTNSVPPCPAGGCNPGWSGYAANRSNAPTNVQTCSTNCTPVSGPTGAGISYFDNYSTTSTTGARPMVHPSPSTGGWGGSTYWLENFYSGTSSTSTIAYTSIEVPSSGTVDGDQFALVLSEFDSNNYYDQIGLASDYGCPSGCGNSQNTWSIAYEQGTYGTYGSHTGCGWGGTHSRDGYDSSGLTPFSWYTFLMYLTGSNLVFKVYAGYSDMNTTPVWTTSISDSASDFLIQDADSDCAGEPNGQHDGASSNSLYEEVTYIYNGFTQNVPRWNFNFSQTTYASWGGSGWTYTGAPEKDWYPQEACSSSCPTIPHTYYIDWSEYPRDVVIANEAMMLSWWSDTFSITGIPGTSPTQTGSIPSIGQQRDYGPHGYGLSGSWPDYCFNNTCDVSYSCSAATGLSAGYSISPWPTSTVPSSVSYYEVAPIGASTGTYYSGCTAQITSTSVTESTTFIWYVTVS